MTLNDVVFVDLLPKLDLHGYDRETGAVAINDFIKDNIKLKRNVIAIVHGNGSGILRTMTRELLKRHQLVINFKTTHNNSGCTIAELRFDK